MLSGEGKGWQTEEREKSSRRSIDNWRGLTRAESCVRHGSRQKSFIKEASSWYIERSYQRFHPASGLCKACHSCQQHRVDFFFSLSHKRSKTGPENCSARSAQNSSTVSAVALSFLGAMIPAFLWEKKKREISRFLVFSTRKYSWYSRADTVASTGGAARELATTFEELRSWLSLTSLLLSTTASVAFPR